MAKRKTATVRVDSTEVQGEGSYVVIKRLKWGEIKSLTKKQRSLEEMEAAEQQDATIQMTDDLIAPRVIDWNWVDDDDKPLPIPKDHPSIIDELTDEEFQFLGDAIAGNEDTRKN